MDWRQVDAELGRDTAYARAQAPRSARPPPDGDLHTEVAIVGGGLAGLSIAYELARRGRQVRLLEAGRLAGGASGRNGGQVLPGLACDMVEIEGPRGRETARLLWAELRDAVATVRRRALRWQRGQWQDGHLTVAVGARKARALRQSVDAQARLDGQCLEWAEGPALARWIDSPRYAAGAYDARAGHIDPLDYALGLAEAAEQAGAHLHENSPVLRLTRGATSTLHLATGRVRAEQVVLAAGLRNAELAPELAGRVLPVGTYVGATAPLDGDLLNRLLPLRCAVCDTDVALDYFRPSHDGRLIFGGGVSYSARTPTGLPQRMQRRLAAVFPELSGQALAPVWGGLVDITASRAPDFGRLGQDEGARIFHLQGFSGHGLALCTWAGRSLALALTGHPEAFDRVAGLRHLRFPGGPAWRMPLLVLGMAWQRLADLR